jgi:hypothetical protein
MYFPFVRLWITCLERYRNRNAELVIERIVDLFDAADEDGFTRQAGSVQAVKALSPLLPV